MLNVLHVEKLCRQFYPRVEAEAEAEAEAEVEAELDLFS